MSVTFFAPEAPTTTKEVDYGDGDVVLEIVSCLPEVNVSNDTASTLIDVLRLPVGARKLEGSLSEPDLDAAIKQAFLALNNRGSIAQHVLEACEEVGPMRARKSNGGVTTIGRGAHLHDFGCSEDRIVRRVGHLLDLFKQARASGYTVCWG